MMDTSDIISRNASEKNIESTFKIIDTFPFLTEKNWVKVYEVLIHRIELVFTLYKSQTSIILIKV